MVVRIIGCMLGGCSLIYFGIYAAFAGLTNKFTYFWLLFGLLCLLLAGFYRRIQRQMKKVPKPVKVLAAAVFGICVTAFLILEGLIIGYGASAPRPGADYVIVLGAQVKGSTPSYNLARRLDAAYDYLEENPQTQVILSGGQGEGEDISEAQAMAEYLLDKGIAKERMILEEQSTNTDENLRYSREKMQDQDASVVLVTNHFHVYRSIRIAKKQGLMNVEGLGAEVMWYTIPNLYLREAVAIVKYAVCGEI